MKKIIIGLFLVFGCAFAVEKMPVVDHLSDIEDFDARIEYANLLMVLKRYPEAMKELQFLLKEGRNQERVLLEMARLYYFEKEYDEAVGLLAKVSDPKLQKQKSKLIVDIFVGQKEFQKAATYLQNEIDQGKGEESTLFELAQVLSWAKEYKKSIALYEELLQKRPDDVQLRRHFARVLFWAKEYERSAVEWKKTLP